MLRKIEEIWWNIIGIVGYVFITISAIGLVTVLVMLIIYCLIGE